MNREHTLTARYQSRAQAEAAAKELERSGVVRERVALVDPPAETVNGKFSVVVRCVPGEIDSTKEVLRRTVPAAIE